MQISFLLPLLVGAVGLFLLIKLRFFFVIHPIKTAREFTVALKDREARRSFFLALAGTLGVGNIFGVSAGIMIGGPGSLFWLFVSSVFAMIIKYAETLLTFDSKKERGGTSAVLADCFKSLGWLLSPLYAAMTLLLAFFMGSAMQSAAVIDVAEQTMGINPIITAIILAVLLVPCLIGGGRKIENITETVVPVTTIIYIIMCFCVIFLNFQKFPDIIFKIVSSAISPLSMMGGATALAIKEGFARGILSNEAGVGTSAMAHSRSRKRSPHVAGLFGMCEVVFDSIILCMLTGFVILITIDDISAFSTPMSLVFAAFKLGLGETLAGLLLPAIFFFAYATLICWYFYGKECVSLYFSRVEQLYPPLFLGFVFLSGVISSNILLSTIDVLLFFMSLMTLSAIVKKADRIRELTKNPE